LSKTQTGIKAGPIKATGALEPIAEELSLVPAINPKQRSKKIEQLLNKVKQVTSG